MTIYGTTVLAICLLAGQAIGTLLGMALGIGANVGGVGIAMLLLIVLTARLQQAGCLQPPAKDGILFWSSIYIPVVVAMAAGLDVRGAISNGMVAIVVGAAAAAAGFALVPVLAGMASAAGDTKGVRVGDGAVPAEDGG